MNSKFPSVHKFTFALAFALFLFATSALAGPPLICHTFDIGNAKSLPWIGHNWNLTGTESYDINNLSSDTIAILDSDATVLVHMETLRRAALYTAKNPNSGKRLLLKLMARSDSAAKNTPAAGLAAFDLGYFAETLGQVHWIYKDFPNPAQGLDGYALVKQAIQLRANDPQMNFAAALITLDNPNADQQGHAKTAFLGAQSDSLLSRNLSMHFMSPQSETIANMISRNSNTKVARQ